MSSARPFPRERATMMVQIEPLNYRSLHHVSQALAPFQILVGPNASGKSTFLDVVAFLADVVRDPGGAASAVRSTRAPDVRDLCWMGQTEWFGLAGEAGVAPGLNRPG